MDIQDRVAIITGGASGLGKATAEALVARGAKVFLFDLTEGACSSVVNELGRENCAYAITDVTDEGSVNSGLDQAMKVFGDLHIVINAAGIGPPAEMVTHCPWQNSRRLLMLTCVALSMC